MDLLDRVIRNASILVQGSGSERSSAAENLLGVRSSGVINLIVKSLTREQEVRRYASSTLRGRSSMPKARGKTTAKELTGTE